MGIRNFWRDAGYLRKLGRCRGKSRTQCDARDEPQQRPLRKAEIAAAKGDTRELFRLTRKMAPPQRLPTQTVRQCCPTTGALGERCWTQDEELDARTHALEYIFEGTAGESPEITVDDPKDQISEATEIPVGPFAAADVVRAVKGLTNYKAGPNIVKNEGERGWRVEPQRMSGNSTCQ